MKLRVITSSFVLLVYLIGVSYSYADDFSNIKGESKQEKKKNIPSSDSTKKTKKLNESERLVLRKQIESAGKDIYGQIPKSK